MIGEEQGRCLTGHRQPHDRRAAFHSERYVKDYRIDSELQVRVCDTALARDLFPQDYHCLGDNENRPVKWLSLEALIHKQFTPANDGVSTMSPSLLAIERDRRLSLYSKDDKLYRPNLAPLFCGPTFARIDSELQVRVCDTALARDLFPQDYHCLGDNENRPVKWLMDFLACCCGSWRRWPSSPTSRGPFEMAAYLREGFTASPTPNNCPDGCKNP
ncbi:Tyrosine-protein kinase RYK [Chionoecetes opilio]|uniref:Tyrosine-protein kinase RYK n=1 Tax=Chionoecetes opilio TaxID=41210 RepID=A0A8J4YBH0_CHIOP|nr:Tyrosine-protein kinase RYK [Chionoecetes opilio]